MATLDIPTSLDLLNATPGDLDTPSTLSIQEKIEVYEPDLTELELEYVVDCMKTGWISGIGEYVKQFEKQFSAFCDVSYGIATCNGTVALELALATLKVGPGDEVIVPNLTFAATANAICHLGAQPIFVDSDPETWTIDPNRIEEAITPRTKAIIAVHLYGHPADMDPIMQIAYDYGLFVIEDAAEAHGALYKKRRVGSIGHMACFSFYGNKIITTGEGGMVVTNNPGLAERARFLRGQAMTRDNYYWHPEVGYNFRMTNLQAAIGVAQLKRIHHLIEAKRNLAKRYSSALEMIPGIITPPEADWATNVFWMYSILIRPEVTGTTRDEVRRFLLSRNIQTRPFFFPISTLPPYISALAKRKYPVSERLAMQGLNLPSSPKLSEEQIDRIVKTVQEALVEKS